MQTLRRALRRAKLEEHPAQIEEQIANGDLLLLRSDDLIVLWTIFRNKDTDERYFWIYLAYGEGDNLAMYYTPQLLEVARRCDCDYLAFSTYRRGWKRLLWPPWREVRPGEFSHPVPSSPAVDPDTLVPGRVLQGA